MIEFRVDEDYAGARLDKFLRARLSNVPTSHLFKMIRTKKVRVNGRRAQPEQSLAVGDLIAIRGDSDRLLTKPSAAPAAKSTAARPKLNILYEDDWMMAVDKPTGLAVHPGSGITTGTLVDYVRSYLGPRAERNGFSASPAHRLDRDTSGVILVAKRRPAMVHFTDIFTRSRARKTYLTLVKGKLSKARGTIEVPLSEHQQSGESKARRGVNMQLAVTHYQLLGQSSTCAYLECGLETGRTHQIRRHFVSIGHPLAGDRRYGDFAFNREAKARWGLNRLFLHAQRIEFPHPEHGKKMMLEARLPEELQQVLTRAGVVKV